MWAATAKISASSMWQLLKKVRHFIETISLFPGGKHGQAKV
ncbi:putative transposase [Escherichia coli 2-210-07_S4_C1]|nr:putative transposase [Escherichia coli 2-210-07_S4_C1]KDW86049.1 putative transposase [Escherichia coli 2-210-07_S4_C1]